MKKRLNKEKSKSRNKIGQKLYMLYWHIRKWSKSQRKKGSTRIVVHWLSFSKRLWGFYNITEQQLQKCHRLECLIIFSYLLLFRWSKSQKIIFCLWEYWLFFLNSTCWLSLTISIFSEVLRYYLFFHLKSIHERERESERCIVGEGVPVWLILHWSSHTFKWTFLRVYHRPVCKNCMNGNAAKISIWLTPSGSHKSFFSKTNILLWCTSAASLPPPISHFH